MISQGQRYRTKQDIPVTAMTSWRAPYTGGYRRILRAGETFNVTNEPGPGATAVYCQPESYRKLHREFIPLSDRLQFWSYRGFYLCIQLHLIDQDCERLVAGTFRAES
jgi:hypothetical protein